MSVEIVKCSSAEWSGGRWFSRDRGGGTRADGRREEGGVIQRSIDAANTDDEREDVTLGRWDRCCDRLKVV